MCSVVQCNYLLLIAYPFIIIIIIITARPSLAELENFALKNFGEQRAWDERAKFELSEVCRPICKKKFGNVLLFHRGPERGRFRNKRLDDLVQEINEHFSHISMRKFRRKIQAANGSAIKLPWTLGKPGKIDCAVLRLKCSRTRTGTNTSKNSFKIYSVFLR